MKVYVETNRGKLEYTVAEDIKIVLLKVLIALNTNIPVQNFCLKFDSVILDNDKRLSEYNIKDGACLMTEENLSPSPPEYQNFASNGRRVYIKTLLSRLKSLN